MTKILPFIIIAILFLVGGYVLYRKISIQTNPTIKLPQAVSSPSPNNQSFKTFKSEYLNFIVDVPEEFQIKSSNTGVDLVKAEGTIEIVRNGTQFLNIEDYLKDFDKKRNIQVINSESVDISTYDGMKRLEERTVGGQIKKPKTYYIMIDSQVYILSTDSNLLYSDLDQIAQSFRYTP